MCYCGKCWRKTEESQLRARRFFLPSTDYTLTHHCSRSDVRLCFKAKFPNVEKNMTNSHKTDSWKSVHSSAEFTALQTFCIRFNISNENWFNSGKLKRKRGFTKQTKLNIERKRERGAKCQQELNKSPWKCRWVVKRIVTVM